MTWMMPLVAGMLITTSGRGAERGANDRTAGTGTLKGGEDDRLK